MRKFCLPALAVIAICGSAQAALVLHVSDATISSPQSGNVPVMLDVWLEETDATQANVSTYNVGLRLSPTGTVTISGHTAFGFNTLAAPRSLFNGQSPTDRTGTTPTYVAANDRMLTDDWVVSGNAANVAVQNGVKDGLFSITFNVPQFTVGVYQVAIDTNTLEIADADGSPNELTLDGGSITVNAIPEPTGMLLAALGLPLLALRRR